MIEQPPQQKRETMISEYVQLAKELSQHQEGFIFSGLNAEAYAKIKVTDEEYPGMTTPIDELIEKFKTQGIKVVLYKHPGSGNVFILPAGSDDIDMDGLSPKQFQISEDMDPKLKKLILLHQSIEATSKK